MIDSSVALVISFGKNVEIDCLLIFLKVNPIDCRVKVNIIQLQAPWFPWGSMPLADASFSVSVLLRGQGHYVGLNSQRALSRV